MTEPRKIFPGPMDRLGWYFDVFVQWTGRTGPTRSHASRGAKTKCGMRLPSERRRPYGVCHSTQPIREVCRRCYPRA